MLQNDMKLRHNVIGQLDTNFIIALKKQCFCSKHHQKIAYSEKYAFDLETRLL